jgi:predicted anti-sigma-YlaC factor YlaD
MNQHISTDQLVDFLHHALAPEDDAALHAHLIECAPCRTAYQEEAALSEALQSHARATERELPQGVEARIWDALERASSQPTIAERLRAWFRPMVTVPLVAVVALAIVFMPRYVQEQASPTIDAGYYLQDHAAMNGTVPFADSTAAVPVSLTTTADAAR